MATADRGHLHHRLLDRGFSQKKAVLILYGLSAVFGVFAILISGANNKEAIFLSLGLLVIAALFAIKLGFFEKRK